MVLLVLTMAAAAFVTARIMARLTTVVTMIRFMVRLLPCSVLSVRCPVVQYAGHVRSGPGRVRRVILNLRRNLSDRPRMAGSAGRW
jgi:hypothetical protein